MSAIDLIDREVQRLKEVSLAIIDSPEGVTRVQMKELELHMKNAAFLSKLRDKMKEKAD